MASGEELDTLAEELLEHLDHGRVVQSEVLLRDMHAGDIVDVLEREDVTTRAKLYRLLKRDMALEVFERLDPSMRAELFSGLGQTEVVAFFEEMDPDDRASLVGELPAGVAHKLMRGLSSQERALTSPMLGYPKDSIGRWMSTEYVRVLPTTTVEEALARAKAAAADVETIYAVIVTDPNRLLLGVVSLRRLLASDGNLPVDAVMSKPVYVQGSDEAEQAARSALREGFHAVPVVDAERRLIGILTADDAYRILDRAEDEDIARAGASEALDKPYLATPVRGLVKARIVWLFVLGISAILTVQVMDVFEDSLAQVVTLALFIPLLIGVGGNAGSQSASTVTRALAVGEVRPRDIGKVFFREIRVGGLLGLLLGTAGFTLAGLFLGWEMGAVIGLTLLAICTTAATVGGLMPLLARAVKADPAVFSTPFIATFVDATGLILYFTIARAVLGI